MPTPLSRFARRPLRGRLWLGGFALAVLLAALTVGNAFLADARAVSARMFGMDFLAFYTAGQFVREGQPQRLYDIPAVKQRQDQLARENHLDLGPNVGPFWNPPFYAWAFVPLAALPFRLAVAAWLSLNLAALAGAMFLLSRMLVGRVPAIPSSALSDPPARSARADWRAWALVPLLLIVSMPFVLAFGHGQNTFGSLLLLSATVTLWRGRRAVPAGLVAALLFYKPQLGALVAGVLVVDLGLGALLGLAAGGAALLLVNLLTLPGTLGAYLHQLPQNVHFMQVQRAYNWERHATLKAFWRLLLQGRGPGELGAAPFAAFVACWLALASALLLAVARGRRSLARRDRLIAATIAAMPLLMPFYFDYDLLLLAVPAVLLAREKLHGDGAGAGGTVPAAAAASDRWLARAWVALYAGLFVNQGLARVSGVNGTVVLLAAVAGLSIARALRRDDVPAALPLGEATRERPASQEPPGPRALAA